MKSTTLIMYLLLSAFAAAPASALSLVRPAPAVTPEAPWVEASGNCYGVGERAARNAGGTMVGVRSAVQNGRPVCIVVVSVPGPDGKRPRLQEIVVPQ